MAKKLSEAYKDTPLQLKHIIPLDFELIQELPESHSWTQTDSEKSACQTCDGNKYCIPVIDLMSPNVVELVGNASKKWGIFQVTNHGVPMNVINDVESHARRLFALPTERKLKAIRSSDGATGYGVARISPFFSKFMWHEGFTIMGSSSVEHAKELWPQDFAEFCGAMDNYQNEMKSLSHKILIFILKALGMEDHGDQEMVCSVHQSDGALQLNSYPCCPNPSQAIGLAPHTDTLFLTILHQNDTNGLQIFQDDIWISVPPVSGALIVNIGDLLHMISNARFPTSYHRVVPNETTHRFTMGYFYGPHGDSIVAPLPILGPPRYRSLTVKEYIGLKNKYLEKALSLVRI